MPKRYLSKLRDRAAYVETGLGPRAGVVTALLVTIGYTVAMTVFSIRPDLAVPPGWSGQ